MREVVEQEEEMEVSVGGRVCLFGEHSDWAGAFRSANSGIEKGQVIVVGTEQQLYARVRRQEGTLTVISTKNDGTKVCESFLAHACASEYMFFQICVHRLMLSLPWGRPRLSSTIR